MKIFRPSYSENNSLPLEITCVNKTGSQKPYEQITRVGGMIGGVRWSKGISQIIQLIECNEETFFVRRPGFDIPVTIVTNELGYKFIQAVLLFDNKNQLLGMPECIV
jgi:hypothetical protein